MNWQTMWLSLSVISVGQYSVYLCNFKIRNQVYHASNAKVNAEKRSVTHHVNILTVNKTQIIPKENLPVFSDKAPIYFTYVIDQMTYVTLYCSD